MRGQADRRCTLGVSNRYTFAVSGPEILGNIYGMDTSGTGAQIDLVNFTLGIAPGGGSLDMAGAGMWLWNGSTSTDLTGATPLVGNSNPGPDQWAIVRTLPRDLDATLDPSEMMDITVQLADSRSSLSPGDRFILEIRPAGGSPVVINGTAPSVIYPINLVGMS